jgi:hypothetical protein
VASIPSQCHRFKPSFHTLSGTFNNRQKERKDFEVGVNTNKGFLKILSIKNQSAGQAHQFTTVIPALGRWRQKHHEFKASLGYKARLVSKRKPKKLKCHPGFTHP